MSAWDGLAQVFEPSHQHVVDVRDSTLHVARVPGTDHDPHRTWVDLDHGVVHLALPPARYGAAWTARPEAAPKD